jgi:hypothetical protein
MGPEKDRGARDARGSCGYERDPDPPPLPALPAWLERQVTDQSYSKVQVTDLQIHIQRECDLKG